MDYNDRPTRAEARAEDRQEEILAACREDEEYVALDAAVDFLCEQTRTGTPERAALAPALRLLDARMAEIRECVADEMREDGEP
jgi:hypothetical protein